MPPEFQKTFLLHIVSPDAPLIDGNTIVTENSTGGQLRLISLTDNAVFDPIGGEGRHQYLNGSECLTASGAHDKHWGRVEISLPSGEKDGGFLHVLCVTDAGNTAASPDIRRISGSCISGASFGSVYALFADARKRTAETLCCDLPAAGDVYLCGIAAGKWNVSADGNTLGTYTASEEGCMLVLHAPAGHINFVHI